MKNFKYIYSLLIAAFLLQSCQEEVDLTLDNSLVIPVIEGQLNDIDSLQWVKLSITVPYFDNDPPTSGEVDGTVSLFENGDFVGEYSYNPTTRQYELQYDATVGYNYSLRIELPGDSVYITDDQELRPTAPIDSLTYDYIEDTFGNFYAIQIYTQEIPGKGNYYQWKKYINDEYLDEPFDMQFNNDEAIDGQPILGLDLMFISEDDFNDYLAESADSTVKVEIVQMGIAEGYFNFLNLIFQQTAFVGGPFDSPPAEIKSNLYLESNPNFRAAGYWYTASLAPGEVVIEP